MLLEVEPLTAPGWVSSTLPSPRSLRPPTMLLEVEPLTAPGWVSSTLPSPRSLKPLRKSSETLCALARPTLMKSEVSNIEII